jgi:cell division protein FtsX
MSNAMPRRSVVLAAAGLAVVVAGAVVAIVLTRSDLTATAAGQPAAGHGICATQVSIAVQTDEEAQQIIKALHADQRVDAAALQDKQQTYQIFETEFQDQPSLAALGRPEALPAQVWIRPAAGVDPNQLVKAYKAQFPTAQYVQAANPCGPTPAG